MSFTLTPQGLAEILEPALDDHPTVVPFRDGVMVEDPLRLKVSVHPRPDGHGYQVRCSVRADDVRPGAAFLSANAVNLTGARAPVSVTPVGDDVLVVSETTVFGPIQPTAEFASAIDAVIDTIEGFAKQLKSIQSMLDAVLDADAPAEAPNGNPPIERPRDPRPRPAAPVVATLPGSTSVMKRLESQVGLNTPGYL